MGMRSGKKFDACQLKDLELKVVYPKQGGNGYTEDPSQGASSMPRQQLTLACPGQLSGVTSRSSSLAEAHRAMRGVVGPKACKFCRFAGMSRTDADTLIASELEVRTARLKAEREFKAEQGLAKLMTSTGGNTDA